MPHILLGQSMGGHIDQYCERRIESGLFCPLTPTNFLAAANVLWYIVFLKMATEKTRVENNII